MLYVLYYNTVYNNSNRININYVDVNIYQNIFINTFVDYYYYYYLNNKYDKTTHKNNHFMFTCYLGCVKICYKTIIIILKGMFIFYDIKSLFITY